MNPISTPHVAVFKTLDDYHVSIPEYDNAINLILGIGGVWDGTVYRVPLNYSVSLYKAIEKIEARMARRKHRLPFKLATGPSQTIMIRRDNGEYSTTISGEVILTHRIDSLLNKIAKRGRSYKFDRPVFHQGDYAIFRSVEEASLVFAQNGANAELNLWTSFLKDDPTDLFTKHLGGRCLKWTEFGLQQRAWTFPDELSRFLAHHFCISATATPPAGVYVSSDYKELIERCPTLPSTADAYLADPSPKTRATIEMVWAFAMVGEE